MTSEAEKPQAPQQKNAAANRRSATILFGIVVGMFGFGFAMVPLYQLVCSVTGISITTSGGGGRSAIGTVEVAAMQVDESRLVTVEFDSTLNQGLDWEFQPLTKKMQVHPGQVYEAYYRVRSTSSKASFGQAVPSVSPGLAAKHFNKTECFCFTKQELAAYETRDMPIRFIIDRGIDEGIGEVTLSYTFFSLEQG